ncbi:MAG: glycosyltransferase family 39 protein [Anaerolineales bacterium]|nr:glycosyltransferase family 39 protein [Anaerolineales bacterium]
MQEQTLFFSTKTARTVALLILFTLGIAIRLYDLTDLPLEFHSTRQLLSALKARGMYYETRADVSQEERAFAIQQWKFRASVEPEFFERIVAWTYQFTGEKVWVARIYSSAFWLIGGVFLYLLARRLTSEDGAIAATAVYLFLPYAVIASRSFQPDPLMTMLIVMFLWAVWQWSSTLTAKSAKDAKKNQENFSDHGELRGSKSSWLFAILAGLFGGLAIFIKFPAAFFIVGGGLGAALSHRSMKEALKNPQLYVMALLGILPGAGYLIYGIFVEDFLGQQFGGRFIPSLFLSPSYYLGWLNMLNLVTGGFVLMLALLGLFFFDMKKRRLLLGLWAGYAFFGLYFNFHISTHDYYSLPLIPIAALSIAPLANALLAKLSESTETKFLRLSSFLILLLGLIASTWNIRNGLNAVDYRPQAAMWAEIGVKTDGYNLAGLTQDYGARMAYWGWQNLTSWPSHGDLRYSSERGGNLDFEEQFTELAAKKDLFIVTDFVDLDLQPYLKEKLKAYPIFADGDGYVIYNLMK